jgi:hypothetical protein
MDLHKALAGSWLQLSSSYTGALCQGLETGGQVEDKPTIRYSILITLE